MAQAQPQAYEPMRIFALYKIAQRSISLASGSRLLVRFIDKECRKCSSSSFKIVDDDAGTVYKTEGQFWSCATLECRCRLSIRSGSWFAGSQHKIAHILILTYLLVVKAPVEFMRREVNIGCRGTLVDWQNLMRKVCKSVIESDSDVIGGPGVIVEIDESKFGKRMFNRGRRVDGTWVFGGVEKDNRQKCFLVCVPNRTSAILIPIIK